MKGKSASCVDGSGVDEAILSARVKDVLAREWGIDAASIPDDAGLNRFEKWDSLGHISILLALAANFGLPLNAENVQSLQSIRRITDYLAQLQKSRGATA